MVLNPCSFIIVWPQIKQNETELQLNKESETFVELFVEFHKH